MAVKKATSATKAVPARKTAPATKGTTTPLSARKTAPATKGTTKAEPARKTATKATTKAEPARKTATKAVPARKTAPAIKGTPKPVPAKAPVIKKATKSATTPASRSTARNVSKAAATATPLRAHKTAASTSTAQPRTLRVREDETPWTARELKAVRAELEADIARLHHEISVAASELAGLMRDAGDGAGDDQADAGTKTFEREQEISLANNARVMFEQSEHALGRIVDRSYGICESCGNPIGKNRLLAFPRATLCMSCKSKQERR
jgi:RNA polymerase-binding transcription factor DksA